MRKEPLTNLRDYLTNILSITDVMWLVEKKKDFMRLVGDEGIICRLPTIK